MISRAAEAATNLSDHEARGLIIITVHSTQAYWVSWNAGESDNETPPVTAVARPHAEWACQLRALTCADLASWECVQNAAPGSLVTAVAGTLRAVYAPRSIMMLHVGLRACDASQHSSASTSEVWSAIAAVALGACAVGELGHEHLSEVRVLFTPECGLGAPQDVALFAGAGPTMVPMDAITNGEDLLAWVAILTFVC